jgi:hypothetical protein
MKELLPHLLCNFHAEMHLLSCTLKAFISKPRVARLCELPWDVDIYIVFNTVGVVQTRTAPTGLNIYMSITQGTLPKRREPWALR